MQQALPCRMARAGRAYGSAGEIAGLALIRALAAAIGWRKRLLMRNPRGQAPTVRKGIAYWPTYEAARDAKKAATDRIVCYTTGWAIQIRVSGPYRGPNGEEV
jgi:hypothetical protein